MAKRPAVIDLGEAKTTALARRPAAPVILAGEKADYSAEELAVIKQTVAKQATDVELSFFLSFAKAAGLNPYLKEIYFIKRNDPESGGKVATIQTGIDGFRKKAHATASFAGMDEPEWGPVKQVQAGGNYSIEAPEWCRFTVYRIVKGARVKFSAVARWAEYAPNLSWKTAFMWKKRPFGQLEKCAEALVLRRAFAEAVGGLYVDEELDQAGPPVVVDLPDEKLATPARVVQPPAVSPQEAAGEAAVVDEETVVEAEIVQEPAERPPQEAAEPPSQADAAAGWIEESGKVETLPGLKALMGKILTATSAGQSGLSDERIGEVRSAIAKAQARIKKQAAG